MAIEIVDFPIKNGDFPWQNVSSPGRGFIFELNNFTDYCLPYSYQHSTWDACHVAGLAVVLVITGVFIQDMRRSVRDRSMSASSVHGMLGSQETMKVAQTDNNIMLYLGSCSLAARVPCEPQNSASCFPGFLLVDQLVASNHMFQESET